MFREAGSGLPNRTATSQAHRRGRVDVLANCFVKRNNITRQLQVPKPDVDDITEGLSLRELVDPSADLDDEGLF